MDFKEIWRLLKMIKDQTHITIMIPRTETSKWPFGKFIYYLTQKMKEDSREEGKNKINLE